MKFIKVLVLVIMFLSFLPLHGFCGDGCDASVEHACVSVCQMCAHNVVLPTAYLSVDATPGTHILLSTYSFSYENPTRLGIKRPPVLSA